MIFRQRQERGNDHTADASRRAAVDIVEFAAMRRSRDRLHGVEIRGPSSRSQERRIGIASVRLYSQIVRQPSRLQARAGKNTTEGIEDVKFRGSDDIDGNAFDGQRRKMVRQLLAKGLLGHGYNRHSTNRSR